MIKSQALGGRSNRALIFLGLFLGLVSAVLVVVYLKSAGGDGGDVSSGVLTPVVVANQSIPIGTSVTEEMVTIKDITSDAVLAEAYRDTGDVVGKVTLVPLVAGEQVIPSKVTATGAAIADTENPPLSYVVSKGQRAVAIKVDSVIAASGLIGRAITWTSSSPLRLRAAWPLPKAPSPSKPVRIRSRGRSCRMPRC